MEHHEVCPLCFIIAVTAQAAHAGQDYKTWKDYGGGPDSSHFVDLKQINKSNVNQLEVAWIYRTGDERSYVFNPIVIDNVMYVMARNSSLVALSRHRKEIWITKPPRIATRGISTGKSKTEGSRLIFAINNHCRKSTRGRANRFCSAKRGGRSQRELGRDTKR